MDDAGDALTRRAIRQAFEAYHQYHETVEVAEVERVAQLKRASDAVAVDLGGEVNAAAVPQRNGSVRVCLWFTASAPEREPAW